MSPALRASLQTASLQYLFTGAADDMLFGVRIELDRSIDGWRIRLTS